jgi:hypothetical protein
MPGLQFLELSKCRWHSLQCVMAAGQGANLPWTVTIGNQASSVQSDDVARFISYAAPVITQISSFNPNNDFGGGPAMATSGEPIGEQGPFALDELDTNGKQHLCCTMLFNRNDMVVSLQATSSCI